MGRLRVDLRFLSPVYWYRRWKLRVAIGFLDKLDKALKVHPRYKRKQFWRELADSENFRAYALRQFPRILKGRYP